MMNNLSTSLAQTLPIAASGPPTSRAALIESASSWAKKAIEVTASIQPPERTEECNIGCAVATHNLGEFAEMNGLISEARMRYREAESLAKAVDFQEGVSNAQKALQRLNKNSK
jgi:hypothetical protein